jgi:hypothetical protein
MRPAFILRVARINRRGRTTAHPPEELANSVSAGPVSA